MKKRVLSLLLAVMMIVSLVPMNASASTNGRTAQEALTWVRSQLGKSLDYDGYPSDQPYQCVDLIKFYYAYLGCASYAVGNAYQYASNTLPSGWARYQGAQPQAGDILVYSGNTSNPYGHVAIYESDYVTYHQNFNGNQYVVKYTGKYTSCENPYWGVIRPDFSSAAVTASWEGPTVTDITETNAKIEGKVNYSSVVTTTKVGVRLYDSSNNLVASKDESVSYNWSYTEIWYDITSELGVTLVSGKTYKAALYAIANGKEYWSPTVSFTTAHTHSYTNKVTAATCTTKGYTTHTCACGNSYVDTYVDALGHSYKSVVTPASCTSAGYTTYTCSVCQDTYKGDNVSALGHNYVNGVCTRCSATDPDYHAHNYTGVVTAPTCTEKGYTTYTCACGDSYVGSYTNALGHSYTNGVCDRCGAAEPKSEDGSIIVSTAKARAGSNVTVDISLKDNPGVSAITLAIDYDTDKLELVSSEDGGLTGWFVAKKAVWTSSGADSSYNGVILSLTFKVKEGVEDGTIPVTVSYSSGDIGNNDEESLFPSVVAGGVTVFSVLPGDINGDGNVNSLDLIRLKKYIADDTTALVGSGDVNGDGNVNSLDLIRLKKYIAGSDVELF